MYGLNDLSPSKGSTHYKKRVGRGIGSGMGKTATRGQKGQKARAGGNIRSGFEGGQMPLSRRLPKFGFKNNFAKIVAVVNLIDIEKRFEDGAVIDAQALVGAKLVKGTFDKIKVLGSGEVSKKFTIKVDAISKQARQKVENAGGTVEVTGG